MGSQVPSPAHVGRSQLGGKVPTSKPQETNKVLLVIIQVKSLIIFIFMGLVSRVGSSFLLDSLSKQVPILVYKKCCHVGIHVILGTYDLRLISPNFHALIS